MHKKWNRLIFLSPSLSLPSFLFLKNKKSIKFLKGRVSFHIQRHNQNKTVLSHFHPSKLLLPLASVRFHFTVPIPAIPLEKGDSSGSNECTEIVFPRMIKQSDLVWGVIIAPHTALARNRAAGNRKYCDVM